MIAWVDDGAPLPLPATVLAGDVPGLVAAGGRLTPARLDEAYRLGLFPWYSAGQPVLWWSPDPRMVLPVAEFRLGRSLRRTLAAFLQSPGCAIRFDTAFARVIRACALTPRDGQDGTWIVPAIVEAYTEWHRLGRTHSVETWVDGALVGGLYFVAIGNMVYGESMFAHRTDASKIALAALVAACRARGVGLIDCQQYTGHLASMGARQIARSAFEQHLSVSLERRDGGPWTYDPAHWADLDPRLAGPAKASA